MKVWGLNPGQIHAVAAKLELDIDNGRRDGRAYAFRLIPQSSLAKYSRRTRFGHRVKATCYHGFRDFISVCFSHGAYRVQSAHGDWRSEESFVRDLYRLRTLNVGSIMEPAYMADLCDCETPENPAG